MPVKPNLEEKKRRLLKIKSLLNLASQMVVVESVFDEDEKTLCEDKVEELKEEQYRISREI